MKKLLQHFLEKRKKAWESFDSCLENTKLTFSFLGTKMKEQPSFTGPL
jgi:hypothetical protein